MNQNLSAEEKNRASQIRQMFSDIAPRYDFLNHLLSLNIDKRWRRFTIKKLRGVLEKTDSLALDICCGTGDLSLELGKLSRTIGMDFCHPMVFRGLKKAATTGLPIKFCVGDALKLPFQDSCFNVVTIAFGLRNLVNIDAGLKEIYRVLKSDGSIAILEFSHPIIPGFRQIFNWYFNYILPQIGRIISKSQTAYSYLPNSVKAFPSAPELKKKLSETGFKNITYNYLCGGIAALHLGVKI